MAVAATPVEPEINRPQPAAYISNPFTVFMNAFKAVLNRNLGTLLGLTLIMIGSFILALLIIMGLALSLSQAAGGITILLLIGVGIVWLMILAASFTKYALATSAGEPLTLAEAFRVGWRKGPGYLGVVLLAGLAVVLGLIALIIPGLLFMYWFLWAPYIYIDQEVGVLEALRRSRQLVRGKLVEILGLAAASSLFAIPTFIPIIGIFYQVFYNGAGYLAWAYRYQSAKQLGQGAAPKPDQSNWWAIILMLVGSGLFLAIALANGLTNR